MRNDFAIVNEQRTDGKLYLFMDTSKAVLRGMKWSELGDWGKRKLETLLILTRQGKEQIRVKYVYPTA